MQAKLPGLPLRIAEHHERQLRIDVDEDMVCCTLIQRADTDELPGPKDSLNRPSGPDRLRWFSRAFRATSCRGLASEVS